MEGRRRALIIASDEYDHPGLSRLQAPAADADALANVLGDEDIGGFHVDVVHNAAAHVVQGHIEDLFADSLSDDLVLLHFSGHGLKSDSGELFFAAHNTRPDRLGSTAVPAEFVQRCIRGSRARSIVLFLDCCYGGAFGEGVAVRAAGSANVLESFPAGRLGGGRGRAVITASSAMEYAFEGNSLTNDQQQQPSVFTAALVEGLSSGEADRDEDGLVSLNELYDYVYDRVRERNPKQTPGRDVELQGELYLARSHRRRLQPLPIPSDVAAALQSENIFTRLGAVTELRSRMSSTDLGAALGAYQALVEVSRSDIRYVQEAASEALAIAVPSPHPAEVHFGTVVDSDVPVTKSIRLAGPPLAVAVTVSQSEAWVTVNVKTPEVQVSLDTIVSGSLAGTVTLTGPTGLVVIPVSAHIAAPAPERASEQSEPSVAIDVPLGPEALTVQAVPRGIAAVRQAPAPDTSAAPLPMARPYWKLSGIAALVSGTLMLLCIVLKQQWDTVTYENDPIKAKYLLYLGLIVLAVGGLALSARWRVPGLGAVIGVSTIGTAVAVDMANSLAEFGIAGLNGGFWVGFFAPFILIAAGGFAVAAARRDSDAGFVALSRPDWASGCVLILAVAGALTFTVSALDTYSSSKGWALQGLWTALLCVAVPLAAVLARPLLLARGMLVGWSLAGVAPVLATWLFWEDADGTSHGMWFVLLTLAAMACLSPILHRGRVPSPGVNAS